MSPTELLPVKKCNDTKLPGDMDQDVGTLNDEKSSSAKQINRKRKATLKYSPKNTIGIATLEEKDKTEEVIEGTDETSSGADASTDGVLNDESLITELSPFTTKSTSTDVIENKTTTTTNIEVAQPRAKCVTDLINNTSGTTAAVQNAGGYLEMDPGSLPSFRSGSQFTLLPINGEPVPTSSSRLLTDHFGDPSGGTMGGFLPFHGIMAGPGSFLPHQAFFPHGPPPGLLQPHASVGGHPFGGNRPTRMMPRRRDDMTSSECAAAEEVALYRAAAAASTLDAAGGDFFRHPSETLLLEHTARAGAASAAAAAAAANAAVNGGAFYQNFSNERESHNEKERKRRCRIKTSCDQLRSLIPGVNEKTDKATVFERAVQYVLQLRRQIEILQKKELFSN